jgi:uncharacterized protein DUF4235
MADKGGDIGIRAVSAIAAMSAAFATRKVLNKAWTKITGKEPPAHPEDPDVGWTEAMGWAMITAVAISAARLLATRITTQRMRHPSPESADKTAEPAEVTG